MQMVYVRNELKLKLKFRSKYNYRDPNFDENLNDNNRGRTDPITVNARLITIGIIVHLAWKNFERLLNRSLYSISRFGRLLHVGSRSRKTREKL